MMTQVWLEHGKVYELHGTRFRCSLESLDQEGKHPTRSVFPRLTDNVEGRLEEITNEAKGVTAEPQRRISPAGMSTSSESPLVMAPA